MGDCHLRDDLFHYCCEGSCRRGRSTYQCPDLAEGCSAHLAVVSALYAVKERRSVIFLFFLLPWCYRLAATVFR